MSHDISLRKFLHKHEEYKIYTPTAKTIVRMVAMLFSLYAKNTDKELTVTKVMTAARICRSDHPDNSNGVLVNFTAVPKVRDAVNILLIAITIKSAFTPIRGTKKAISPSLNAESERLNLSSEDCFPRPFSIPQDTESKNIIGENRAIIRTEEAM